MLSRERSVSYPRENKKTNVNLVVFYNTLRTNCELVGVNLGIYNLNILSYFIYLFYQFYFYYFINLFYFKSTLNYLTVIKKK